MSKYLADKKGFTFIETIIAIVIIGIFAAISGIGLVQVVDGYVSTRENSGNATKIQVALTRITKELEMATSILIAAPGTISYTIPGPATNTITFSGGTVQINGVTLINNISAFVLTYFDAAGATTAVISKIRRVDSNITVNGINNSFIYSTNIM